MSQSRADLQVARAQRSEGKTIAKGQLDSMQYLQRQEDFGYFAFIHQPHFSRLLVKGKAPRELTLLVIASAMRFAAQPTGENLARADAWVDDALGALLPRLHQGFGAIQLMTLLLAQHYDLNRGNFTSAWLLGAECTRRIAVRMMQMMSLQTFDRTYPSTFASNVQLSPLLSREALRRLAWSTLYSDTIVDGGRYGFHTVDEKTYRLQLPCDEATFLSNETAVTEPLFYDPAQPTNDGDVRPPLDMSAYLLRTASTRRSALHFAFRASHKEQTVQQLSAELTDLEAEVERVTTALPSRFHLNSDNIFLHHGRIITFFLLHILRHNLFIVVGRAALEIYRRDPAQAHLIPHVRRKRISHALPIAGVYRKAIEAGIGFDPQMGVHAYVALEILLFEPRRLAQSDPLVDPKAPELTEAIPYLLTVIRGLADRSEFVKQLHVEAVHRLLRCDCTDLLSQTDLDAFLSEYQLVGQDAAEYDFRDFRWAKIERLRRGASSSANVAQDETLLQFKVGCETAAPSARTSPRLDANDVNNAQPRSTMAQSVPSVPLESLNLPEATDIDDPSLAGTMQSSSGLSETEQPYETFPLDWSWFLGGSGPSTYQTGDPTTFWSQL
ncbi:uncharacterized protein LTR77_010292 [Saxophila tyrrhenica]|uniref:Xylanolytic transcriptional activator regulatory domain-containing protein n=1 Tax=Saxophila tyrrhenica TaxID=1690608 RepID=A0AAV9NXD2_9PEZI|nr:hypothetical protein LTR77_010292 [Saxophila tyrrhenica]